MRNPSFPLPLALLSIAASSAVLAQKPDAPAPARVSLKGCVSQLPSVKRYVLASGDKCYLLNPEYKADAVAGKTVILRGTVVQPIDMNPLTLQVTSGSAAGAACSLTCTPEEPGGTRGFPPHGKEKPGTEAGPPGLKPPPQP